MKLRRFLIEITKSNIYVNMLHVLSLQFKEYVVIACDGYSLAV